MATLDIDPLRSFVAVSAFNGVRRAADALHLSPAAVTGHVRRLEAELGCALVVRQGRGVALTSDGEELVARARILLDQHDDAVRALSPPQAGELVLAATEYTAETLVPSVVAAVGAHLPKVRLRFRFSRSAWIRDLAREERADIALTLVEPARGGTQVARLPLHWVGVRDAPRDRVVVYDLPCSVRHLALPALRGRAYEIARECHDLTTLLTAAREGQGVIALPRTGALPDGLVRITDLPALPDITLYAATGPRLDPATRQVVLGTLAEALGSVAAPQRRGADAVPSGSTQSGLSTSRGRSGT